MSQLDVSDQPTPKPAPVATRRTAVALAAVAAVLIGGIAAVAALRPAAPAPADVSEVFAADAPLLGEAGGIVGEPLPDTTLPALGELGPTGGLRVPVTGEPMVINFWASWCAPCLREMPMLQRVTDEQGLTMVGVDYVDQTDRAVALARELGITYPLVTDRDGAFGQSVRLLGTPTTLVVDADGIVRRQLTGELTEAQLRDALAQVR